MTEQEVELLAAQLKRVWELELPPEITERQSWFDDKVIRIEGQVAPTTYLWVEISSDRDSPSIYLDWNGCTLVCYDGIVENFKPPENLETWMEQFKADWLPMFRRGCWLSGCSIEASAHEKAEWMQDFTREELESWNLEI